MDTIAVFSDTHCNSTVGLCPPQFKMDDGGVYKASKAQKWIWSHWNKYWELVRDTHKVNGGKLYVVANGDLVDGDHHGTTQIISRSKTEQAKIALQSLNPMLRLNPDYIFVVRGTEVHVGSSGQDEEAIAEDIGAEPNPATDAHSWNYLKLEIGGVTFDFAHHGKSGGKYWTRMGSAVSDMIDLTMFYIENGESMPDVVFRSHKHIPLDSFDNYKTRLLMLPSWQGSTMFGHKIASGRTLPIGAYIVSCGNNSYTIDKYIKRAKPQKIWRA